MLKTGVKEDESGDDRSRGGATADDWSRGGLVDDTTQREELSRLIEESHINFSAERVIYFIYNWPPYILDHT